MEAIRVVIFPHSYVIYRWKMRSFDYANASRITYLLPDPCPDHEGFLSSVSFAHSESHSVNTAAN